MTATTTTYLVNVHGFHYSNTQHYLVDAADEHKAKAAAQAKGIEVSSVLVWNPAFVKGKNPIKTTNLEDYEAK